MSRYVGIMVAVRSWSAKNESEIEEARKREKESKCEDKSYSLVGK